MARNACAIAMELGCVVYVLYVRTNVLGSFNIYGNTIWKYIFSSAKARVRLMHRMSLQMQVRIIAGICGVDDDAVHNRGVALQKHFNQDVTTT